VKTSDAIDMSNYIRQPSSNGRLWRNLYVARIIILSYVFLNMHELQSMAFCGRKLRQFMSKLTFAIGYTLQLFIICLTKRKGSSHFSALVPRGTKDNLLTG